MVIGDARTQTFATSQSAPDGPRPNLVGLLNGSIQWGGTMWAAITWDTIANWPAETRGEALTHESFHIAQQKLGLGTGTLANEHLDTPEGRYWMRLEWRVRRFVEAHLPSASLVTIATSPFFIDQERAIGFLHRLTGPSPPASRR